MPISAILWQDSRRACIFIIPSYYIGCSVNFTEQPIFCVCVTDMSGLLAESLGHVGRCASSVAHGEDDSRTAAHDIATGINVIYG